MFRLSLACLWPVIVLMNRDRSDKMEKGKIMRFSIKKGIVLVVFIALAHYVVAKSSSEAVPLKGSCEKGRSMGDLRVYTILLKTESNDLGYIRVRSSPLWDGNDTSNVLGTIEMNREIAGWGPLKNRPSYGIGYAVPLKDKNGKTCRGYISATVVKVIDCQQFGRDGDKYLPFPDGLDVSRGGCVED